MSLNIAVLIKQIVDIDQMKTDPASGKPLLDSLPMRMENLSKNAVEAAVKLKETHGGKVTGFIYGTDKANNAMKEAYAMGVDEGYIIKGYRGNNPIETAEALCWKMKKVGNFDLIILGNQSADSYTGLVPGMIAANLSLPLLGNANGIEIEGKEVIVKKAGEQYDETIGTQMPAVISVTQEINQPRLPAVLQIMAAGRKPINVEDYTGNRVDMPEILSNLAPKSDRKKMVFEDVEKGISEVVKVIKGEMK